MWRSMKRQVNRYDAADEHDRLDAAFDAAAVLGDLLGQVGTAAILVDGAGEIVTMNSAARACIGRDLLITQRRLAVEDPRTDRALARLVDKALGRDCRSADDSIVVERLGTRPLIVRAMPLDAPARLLLRPARAMVMVLDAACVRLPTEAQLVSLFALSPAEARLAQRLAAGDTLATAAHVCGISYETARKRVKGIFDLTDTRRQAELVALLVRIGSIFPGAYGATAPPESCESGKPAAVLLAVSDRLHREALAIIHQRQVLRRRADERHP